MAFLNNLLVWLLHEVGFVLFFLFLVSLNAFALHQPVSDKQVGHKSQIHYKNFIKTAGSISVAAEERRAQSLGEAPGLPQPCQTATANKSNNVEVLAQEGQAQTWVHEKAEGITREQRKKRKEVGS